MICLTESKYLSSYFSNNILKIEILKKPETIKNYIFHIFSL